MFRVMVAVGLFMLFFIYLTLTNPETVTVHLYKKVAFHLPMSVLLVVNLAIGFLAAYLLGIAKDIKIILLERRLKAEGAVKDRIVESMDMEGEFSPRSSLRFLENVKVGKEPHLLGLYARFLRKTGRLDEAKEIHSGLVVKEKHAPLVAEFIRDLVGDGRYTEAVSMVKDLPSELLSPAVMKAGAEAAILAGDEDFAAFLAEKLHSAVPSEDTESFLLGIRVDRFKKKGDVKGIKKILKKRPDFIPALYALLEMNEGKALLDALKNAYRKTKDVTYLFWLVDAMVKREGADPKKVMDFIDRLGEDNKETIAIVKAYMFCELGMYQEALKSLEDAGDSMGSIQSYVRFMALKGMGREKEACDYAVDVARKGAFSYRCTVCGYASSELEPRCPSCGNYSTMRLS